VGGVVEETVERRLEMAVSDRDSMNSLTIKSRLEKSSRVKLGPLGKTERGMEEDEFSGVIVLAAQTRRASRCVHILCTCAIGRACV